MRINDIYDISIDGIVVNTKTKRVLKTFMCGAKLQYKSLRLGVGKKYLIHRLVADRFLPSPTDDCVVDHIDRNTLNNHASNLRWVSKKVNANNRTIETIPRPTNSSGHLHICKYSKDKFRVQIRIAGINQFSVHETIEEAIQKRNTILEHAIFA